MINHTLKYALSIVAVAALAVSAAGCGEKREPLGGAGETDRITLLLDWYANPDHAGIYSGVATGAFKRQGLDVAIETPSDPAAVIKQVASGRADIGISYQPEVMSARDQGARVRAVAAIVPTPLNSIMFLKRSGIRSVKDLAGKRVGTSGAYTEAYLRSILSANDVNPDKVDQVNVGFNLQPALVSRKVDATIGAYWNIEAVELRLKGRPTGVIRVDRAGVPPYDELVLIASEDALRDHEKRQRIRRFIAGMTGGVEAAKRDPDAAAKALLDANKDLRARDVKAMLAATLPVLRAEDGRRYGYLSPEKWSRFAGWMRDNELLKNPPEPAGAYTNELLPGAGP